MYKFEQQSKLNSTLGLLGACILGMLLAITIFFQLS